MKNRIGIVGGGQLGRMLTFAAKRLGFIVNILDPTKNSPAGQVADFQIIKDFKDEDAITKLAKISDYLTFEIELANANSLDELEKSGVKVNPSAKTLNIIKDKLNQKKFLRLHNIPLAPFLEVKNRNEILLAIKQFGYPILLKARFDAYDGRGNVLIKDEEDITEGIEKLKGRLLYVEKFIPFKKELAVMVARNTAGEIKAYPVVETIHKNNICHTVFAPASIDKKIRNKAKEIAIKVIKNLKGAGVFGIEMFYTKGGNVFVNEIAPRVHNSGHYSVEACITDQFEQHIRAITGMPLGSSEMVVPIAVMVNILGDRNGVSNIKGLEKALSIPNVSVSIYGKHETRVERKMGHVTAVGKTIEKVQRNAMLARKFLTI